MTASANSPHASNPSQAPFDPAALVSLVQAADWAGVPLGRLQTAVTEGDLRSEVVRQGGREVQRIRMVDLQEWTLAVIAPAAVVADAPNSDTSNSDEPRPVELASEPSESPVPSVASGVDPDAPESSDLSSQEPAAAKNEANAAAVTGSSNALPAEWLPALSLLRDQQEELRDQCVTLRQQWVRSEAEKQRVVDALMQLQDRWTRSMDTVAYAARPWWQRRSGWVAAGLVSAAGLLLWWVGKGSLQDLEQGIANDRVVWAAQLEEQTSERMRFEADRARTERSAWWKTWQEQFEALTQAEETAREQWTREWAERQQADQQAVATWQSQWDGRWSDWARERQLDRQREAERQQQELADRMAWLGKQERQRAERDAELLDAFQDQLAKQADGERLWRASLEASWKAQEAHAISESERWLARIAQIEDERARERGELQLRIERLEQARAEERQAVEHKQALAHQALQMLARIGRSPRR